MKNEIINQAEEICLKIPNVIIQKTIPSEPDILKIQLSDDKYFEMLSTEVTDYEVFRQKWFKTTYCILPSINEDQWIILWKEIIDKKAVIVEAREVSEPVLAAKLFLRDTKNFSITTTPSQAMYSTFLEQNGLLCLELNSIRKWLKDHQFKIPLSTFSRVLIELGVKEEGIVIIPFYHESWRTDITMISWAFYPDALKNWGC
jgi:hypothetical protein